MLKITVTNKGVFFVGKIKDLPLHLKLLGNQYLTLRELISKNLQ